jgi:hypothetical protein
MFSESLYMKERIGNGALVDASANSVSHDLSGVFLICSKCAIQFGVHPRERMLRGRVSASKLPPPCCIDYGINRIIAGGMAQAARDSGTGGARRRIEISSGLACLWHPRRLEGVASHTRTPFNKFIARRGFAPLSEDEM